jgi:CO/xanthine dehydrogenase FAD-binding subunit
MTGHVLERPDEKRIILRPRTVAELSSALLTGGRILGGGVGIMSTAMPSVPGGVGIDLSNIAPDFTDLAAGTAGALTSLAEFERLVLPAWPAVGEAVQAIATPALRRMITVGGVLGARLPRTDLAPALAVHGAHAQILFAGSQNPKWLPVLELWGLEGAFAVLAIRLGHHGASAFRRFSGHQPIGPSLVSVAALRRSDGYHDICVSAATERPRFVSADALPSPAELVADHRASANFRHHLLRILIAEIVTELSGGT